MPGTTTRFAYPYPLGTDPVRDGDNTIQALADKLALRTYTHAEWFSLYPTNISVASGAWKSTTWPATAPSGSTYHDAITADANGYSIATSKPGLYLVYGNVLWQGSSAGRRVIGFHVNSGFAPISEYTSTAQPTGTPFNQSICCLWRQGGPAGRVYLNVYQDSGASLTITDGAFSIARLASTG